MHHALKSMAGALLLVAASSSAVAQDNSAKVRELAAYQGADRHERLVELAKKEGELSVYHVYPALTELIAAFSKKYGIKVKAWRSGSEAVLQRVTTEARGNRFDVDIVQNNAPENEAAWREKLLQEVMSPHHKDLIPASVPSHKAWVGITLDLWTAMYNTNAVKREDLPKSYADLQDPKWKGKLAIEANNHAWFGTLLNELGEAQGAKIFENIVATNGISARKGHSALANLVASGDIPFALTVYSWNPEQLKKKGAPVQALVIPPLIAQPSTIALLRRSANPASALLFYDFLLTDGQKLLADLSFVPTSRTIQHPYSHASLKMIDPAQALDQQDKWLKNFDEMIVKKAK